MPPKGVTFRPVKEPDDLPFLEAVYFSVRELEMRYAPWPDAEKVAFLRQQFECQRLAYAQNCADADFLVILVDGVAAGRLYVLRAADEVRVVDIALLPEFRGRGIGAALLGELQDEAAALGRPLSIYVEKANPANRLYDRLGFRKEADHEVYDYLVWRPPVS